jgi:hypothetical protein
VTLVQYYLHVQNKLATLVLEDDFVFVVIVTPFLKVPFSGSLQLVRSVKGRNGTKIVNVFRHKNMFPLQTSISRCFKGDKL